MPNFDWRTRQPSSPVAVNGALAVTTLPIPDGTYENVTSQAVGGTFSGTSRDIGAQNAVLNDFIVPHLVVAAFTDLSLPALKDGLLLKIQWSRDNSIWNDCVVPDPTSNSLCNYTTANGQGMAYVKGLVLGRYYRLTVTNNGTVSSGQIRSWIYAQPYRLC